MKTELAQNRGPESLLLQQWVAAEVDKGLVSIHFSANSAPGATVESFCGEVNRMLRAPVVPDPTFF